MSRDAHSAEKLPLLKSSNTNTYSHTSSREEARPFDYNQNPLNGDEREGNLLSYQHGSDAADPRTPMGQGQAHNTRQDVPSSNAEEDNDDDEESPLINRGPMVICRVCEAEIALDGKTTLHVVRCQTCNEVTPIRAAPPGKKYVRCPCNCLLVCKASSARIACPRQNCRRVITLATSSPAVGTAVRAPAGTCRVQCAHCSEVIIFNTLSNTVAHCPHCKGVSSVGVRFARARSSLFCVASVILCSILAGLIFGTLHTGGTFLLFTSLVVLSIGASYCLYRFVYYARMKVSQVLGPI